MSIKKKRSGIFAAVAFLTVAIGAMVIIMQGGERTSPPDVTRAISYTIRIRNLSNRVITPLTVETFAPIAKTGWQRVERNESDAPLEPSFRGAGEPERSTVATSLLLPPYAIHVLTVRSQVALWNGPHGRATPVLPADLAPGAFIESGAATVVALAQSLRRESPLETARAIHTWINGNITAESYIEEPRSAAVTLEQKRGDCTEFAHLFTALARANGIPARVVGGFFVERDKHLRAADYHNWAEFFDGAVWRLADPNLNHFDQRYGDYIAFLYLGGESVDDYRRSAERFTSSGGEVVEIALQ
jgi:transglutaminase-like putative cysteine protease